MDDISLTWRETILFILLIIAAIVYIYILEGIFMKYKIQAFLLIVASAAIFLAIGYYTS